MLDRRVGDNVVQLALWDVTGHDDYCQLRPVAYSNVHVILIAFSVDNLESLGNAMNKVRRVASLVTLPVAKMRFC